MMNQNNHMKLFKPNGTVPISILEINYTDDGNYPLKLVHASPSFSNKNIDRFSAVLVYEVNIRIIFLQIMI